MRRFFVDVFFHNLATFLKNVVIKANLSVEGDLSVTGLVPDSRPYKTYVAKIGSDTPNAPVVTVFENTLGVDLSWEYLDVGEIGATASSPIFANFDKVWNPTYLDYTGGVTLHFEKLSDYAIIGYITTIDETPTDNFYTPVHIEIRVYE